MEPDAGGRPEFLPQLRLDELLAELQGRLQAVLATRDRMRGLLEAVVAVSSGLDLESTLRRIVETAVRLVDAIYGALEEADLFVAIGTSGSVYPAAGFVAEARRAGIRTCELNLEPSDNARAFDERRYGPASEIVPAWAERLLA